MYFKGMGKKNTFHHKIRTLSCDLDLRPRSLCLVSV